MKIVTVGRGRIGGGLARLWSQAGHEVITLGRDGGDGSTADVVLIAVPGGAITAALANVTGIAGKVTIDATNAYGQRSTGFTSQAHQIKSIVAGPTAKSFNTNWTVGSALGESPRTTELRASRCAHSYRQCRKPT